MMFLRKAEKKDYTVYRDMKDSTEYSWLDKNIFEDGNSDFLKDVASEVNDAFAITRGEFEERIKSNNEKIFLFCDDCNNIFGYVDIYQEQKNWVIEEFEIKKEFQGQGYGTIFFKMLEKKAKENYGVRTFKLTCYFPGSINFWKKNGFINENPMLFSKTV